MAAVAAMAPPSRCSHLPSHSPLAPLGTNPKLSQAHTWDQKTSILQRRQRTAQSRYTDDRASRLERAALHAGRFLSRARPRST